MANIQIDDIIQYYPSRLEPSIQQSISNKEEFREVGASSNNALYPGTRYFYHQVFTQRFLRAYDRMLLIDETGTGKTCSVIAFCEYCRQQIRNKDRGLSYNKEFTRFSQVYILVSGPSQEEEYINQIICRCSDRTYQDEIEKRKKEKLDIGDSSKTRRSIVLKEFGGYHIKRYGVFSSELEKLSDKAIIEKYSDTIFIIDEAHNIVSMKNDKTTENKGKAKQRTEFWRLSHLIHRSKFMLVTATPMTNDVSEIIPLLNILLPEDGNMPPTYDYTTKTNEELQFFFPDILPEDARRMSYNELTPYFKSQIPEDTNIEIESVFSKYIRGLVSFVRATRSGIAVQSIGEEINIPMDDNIDYHLKLYINEMDQFQEESYIRAANESSTEFQIKTRQASNFIFPDGTWGNASQDEGDLGSIQDSSYSRYVKKSGSLFSATKEFNTYLSNMDNIRRSSIKYYNIVDIEKKNKGVSFIFTNFVEGSGANVLSLCLKAQGFEIYNGNTRAFNTTSSKGIVTSECDNITDNKILHSKIIKAKRCALLTGSITVEQFNNIIELVNSRENVNGEYLQVIIGSRKVREGISINHVLRIHLLEPQWNQSSVYQAISRGIRATSHNILKTELAKQYGNKQPPEILVSIYQHCVIPREILTGFTYPNGIEIYLYTLSEKKDQSIQLIMNMLKKYAVTCTIHRERNDDGQTYTCAIQESPDIDYSTYISYYSDDIVNKYKSYIIDIVRKYHIISLTDMQIVLTQLIGKSIDFKVIIECCYKIMSSGIQIKNEYGYSCYLKESSSMFFLDKDYSNFRYADMQQSFYSSNLIITDPLVFKDLELQKLSIEEIERSIANFENIYTSLPSKYIIDIVEYCFGRFYLEDVPIPPVINQLYSMFFFNTNEPKDKISQISREIFETRNVKVKRGRKALSKVTIMKNIKLTKEDYDDISQVIDNSQNNEPVFLNILNSQYVSKDSYSLISNYIRATGIIRIMKQNEKVWRNTTDAERIVYNSIIQKYIQDILIEKGGKDGIYGIKFPHEDLRIGFINDINEKDSRKNKTGKDIKQYTKQQLIELIQKLGYIVDVSAYDENKDYRDHRIFGYENIDYNTLNKADILYYVALDDQVNNDKNKLYFILTDLLYKQGKILN